MMHHSICLIRKHQLLTQILVQSFALIINAIVHCCSPFNLLHWWLMLTSEILDSISIDRNTFCFAFILRFYRFATIVRNNLSTPYTRYYWLHFAHLDCEKRYISYPTAVSGCENPNFRFVKIITYNKSIRVFVHWSRTTYKYNPKASVPFVQTTTMISNKFNENCCEITHRN